MRSFFRPIACVVPFIGSSAVLAQTATYQPLRTWVDPQVDAFLRWDATRRVQATRPVSPESRPHLPGVRSKHTELLQDAILRKHSKLLKGSLPMARQHLLRLHGTRPGLNVINGALSEAMFLERNPEWGYVKAPNATQHDVYRWVAGRKTPFNGQCKFFEQFKPSRYAQAMMKDSRAQRFFIPEDHVEPMKAYLKHKAQEAAIAGNPQETKRLWRDYSRVRSLGFPTRELIERRELHHQELRAEKYATYVSLGASLALAIGPTMWDGANGSLAPNQVLYRTTRALSLLGVGVGTDLVLATVKDGALRGTIRGNIIVGAAVTITEVTWLLYEHGWQRAFYQPQFYESIGGSVTGLALGMAGAGAAVAWVPGPGWVVGGSAFVAGAGLGAVGYIGGRSATHVILEVLAPKMIQQGERERLASVTSGIERAIAEATAWPPR